VLKNEVLSLKGDDIVKYDKGRVHFVLKDPSYDSMIKVMDYSKEIQMFLAKFPKEINLIAEAFEQLNLINNFKTDLQNEIKDLKSVNEHVSKALSINTGVDIAGMGLEPLDHLVAKQNESVGSIIGELSDQIPKHILDHVASTEREIFQLTYGMTVKPASF